MANYKRSKTKRNVRCTLCTSYRWFGNGKGRFKAREEYAKKMWKKNAKIQND